MAHKNIEDRRAYDAKYARENRAWLRNRHRCTMCGQQDAYTMAGRIFCAVCNEKHNAYQRKYREEHPEKVEAKAAQQREMRTYRLEHHLCTACGDKLPEKYRYRTCEKCRAIKRGKKESYRREEGIPPKDMYRELGLCVRCGKPRLDGQVTWSGRDAQLCERCYNNTIQSAAKGRATLASKPEIKNTTFLRERVRQDGR